MTIELPSPEDIRRIKHDILIIGAGGAGLRAAKIVPDREWIAHDPKQLEEAITYTLQPFDSENDENPYILQLELQQLVSKYKSLGTTDDLQERIGQTG